jgi:ring-1,2-phenylacetyl-CoA epoxidase subunit PaaE
MLEFHALKVASVTRIAEDAICIGLEVPEGLAGSFAFDAGQYVTVRRRIGARDEQRTYSLVNGPGEKCLTLGVRVHANGVMSRHLATEVHAGDLLDIGSPLGRFRTEIDPRRSRSYVAFAAGSGITPVLSIAATVLAREPHSRFTLFYGNRSISRTMFLEDTMALKNRHMQRFAAHFIMSGEQQHAPWLNGRIDGRKVRELARAMPAMAAADEYLVCGPGEMVEEVRSVLRELNAAATVRFERFATGKAKPTEIRTPLGTAAADEVLAMISVTMDGRQRTFPMRPDDPSVLSAAERAGMQLPFSCRAGICATCRTRVTDGAASMAHNIGLERWEVDAGFVLCCQARPTTPTLAISYDEK